MHLTIHGLNRDYESKIDASYIWKNESYHNSGLQ